MIDKRVIEQVLAEQFEELKKLEKEPLVSRPEEDRIQLDSTMTGWSTSWTTFTSTTMHRNETWPNCYPETCWPKDS